jgi:LysR family glycine cleavage system transcriptional activator
MATLPSLSGLRAFEAAARHLSFTRAAEELNVTQTAISHLIRRLEDQLGIPLFVRRNRALELTREAESYLPAVRGAFEDLRRATARLRRSERDGLLTVSTTASQGGGVPGRQSRHRGPHHHVVASGRFPA